MVARRTLEGCFTETWQRSYRSLSPGDQRRCDRAVLAILREESTSGLRIKPILPEKVYSEARLNRGDRIIFRVEKGVAIFIDVVTHDEISKYGKS
jgi:hypothetical protein